MPREIDAHTGQYKDNGPATTLLALPSNMDGIDPSQVTGPGFNPPRPVPARSTPSLSNALAMLDSLTSEQIEGEIKTLEGQLAGLKVLLASVLAKERMAV